MQEKVVVDLVMKPNSGGDPGNDGAAFKKSSGITFGNSEISESGSIFDGVHARINGNLGDGVQ
jgi:hypothetical protein